MKIKIAYENIGTMPHALSAYDKNNPIFINLYCHKYSFYLLVDDDEALIKEHTVYKTYQKPDVDITISKGWYQAKELFDYLPNGFEYVTSQINYLYYQEKWSEVFRSQLMQIENAPD